MRKFEHERGISLVSTALIIGLIVPILYGIIVVFMTVRTNYFAQQIARESTSSVARTFSKISNPADFRACLSDTISDFRKFVDAHFGASGMILKMSLYYKAPGGAISRYTEPPNLTGSLYSLDTFNKGSAGYSQTINELFEKADYIAVGEVFAASPISLFSVYQNAIFPVSTVDDD